MEFPEFTCISPSASPTVPQSLSPGECCQTYIKEISEHVASHFLRILVPYGIIGLFIYFLCLRKKKNLVQSKAKENKLTKSQKSSNVESNVELSKCLCQSVESSKSLGEHKNGYKIGNLIVYNKVIIEERKDNTVVFEGKYFYRPVAVKRVTQKNRKVAEKEVSFLIDCDENVNIVRLHSVKEDKNFVYLALDRWDINLYELVMRHKSKDTSLNSSADNTEIKLWMAYGYPSSQLLKLMRDIVNGLAHLLENEIIDVNINSRNIFVKIKLWRAMISIHGFESLRWQPPEQFNPYISENESMVYGTELFELGRVFFFCISGGHRITNLLDLSRVECIPEAKHLIAGLLAPNPFSRPNVKQVRIHPLLWDSKIKLSFLTDASYRLESEFRMNANSTLLQELEKTGNMGNWSEKMDSDFLRNITSVYKPKFYQEDYDYIFRNVRNLVLLIRKAYSHYYEYPKNIQEILGTLPEEFVYNFSKKFPNLFMAVYTVIKTHCKEEEYFRKYFTAEYVCPPI